MDLQTLSGLVERARKDGALASEILFTETAGHEIRVLRGKVSDRGELRDTKLRIRCWSEGGGDGVAVGAPENAIKLISEALAASARSPSDPHAGPVSRLQAQVGGLGAEDKRYPALEASDRADVALQAERAARGADRRVVTSTFWYEDRHTRRAYANSRALVQEESETVYRAGGAVTAPTEDPRLEVHEEIEARTYASIASLPFGVDAGRRLAALLAPAHALAGPVRVLLAPPAVARIFARIGELFDPDVLPTSFLRPFADERPVLDPRIHLMDDGTLPGALRTTAFDDEGVPPVPLTLILEGRPDQSFLDVRRARARDTRPTGHRRGDRFVPSNLLLRAGSKSVNVIVSELGGRLLRVDAFGAGEELDPATGRFSAPVDAVLWNNGKVEGAVRGARLEGDLNVVLRRVVEVAADTDRVKHVDAPAMILDGFSLVR